MALPKKEHNNNNCSSSFQNCKVNKTTITSFMLNTTSEAS
uniref:Uncharacterized protein n=1 Tax=Rhizophora mucronata TaxID=61149 RepID=A0A2P2QC91_RHIMU